MLRVEPRDAVKLYDARQADQDGWFEAGSWLNEGLIARLDPARARRIEYWMRRAEGDEAGPALLVVSGEHDGDLLEAMSVGRFVWDVLALLLGLPLVAWAVAVFVRRWLRRPRGSPATSTRVGA